MRAGTARGLILINTGRGKGKTTAAMGIVMRASGHKMYVSVLQFIKTPRLAGEARSAERLAPEVEFLSLGKGFVNMQNSAVSIAEHKKAAETALARARQEVSSGSWDVVVLDEINTAVSMGLVDLAGMIDLVKNKPPKLHLILTGRDAPPELIALADLVTEMRQVKHPYENGTPAQRGIDF